MSLNKELKNGFLISALGKYSNYIVQFGVLAVLSRILTPREYGVVSIITVFLIFFQMIIDMGIGPAIIQNKTLTDQQVNGIFSFTILLSLLLSVIFAFLSKPIAIFYDNTQLVGVCLFMSIALLTSGLNMVPQSIILKRKKFLEINIAQVGSSLISGIVGIILALNHFSYYALVISTIVKNSTMLVFIYRHTNLKITRKIRRKDLKAIYSFSKNQFLFNFINYFSRNLDKLLIGKFMTLKDLSYYDRAYMLSLYPNQILTNVITPVIQPIMSEYENQKDIIKKAYLTIAKFLAFIGMPLSVFIFFSADELIQILFGSQWLGSVVTFQILSLSIWVQMILSSTGSIFQSANRTDLLLLSGILSTVLNIISILIGIWIGKIEIIALLLVIAFSFNFLQCNYLLMIKVFKSKLLDFYKILLNPLIISLMISIPLMYVDYILRDLPFLILLIIKTIVSIIVYILGLILTGNINLLHNILKIRK